jgi:hypothetical protein
MKEANVAPTLHGAEKKMNPGEALLKKAIAECEQKIHLLEDPRWPWLKEAIRQGVAANKQQHRGVEYAAEIMIAIDQDYLTALRSILEAADLHTTKPMP